MKKKAMNLKQYVAPKALTITLRTTSMLAESGEIEKELRFSSDEDTEESL